MSLFRFIKINLKYMKIACVGLLSGGIGSFHHLSKGDCVVTVQDGKWEWVYLQAEWARADLRQGSVFAV